MLCEYKNDIMYISCKTLELFRQEHYEEYKQIKILKIHPEYVNYEQLVKLMNEE